MNITITARFGLSERAVFPWKGNVCNAQDHFSVLDLRLF